MRREISCLTSDILPTDSSIRHGFFTRQGGVSKGIYDALNCGPGSADAAENVRRNRLLVSQSFGIGPIALAGVHQVHGAGVHVIRTAADAELRPLADGLVTALPRIGLTVLAADCAPVLFADPEARIIGAAHAGWKGALGGICEAVVAAMVQQGAARRAIRAAVGPCISSGAYETGEDFAASFLARDTASAGFFTASQKPGKRQFALGPYVGERVRRAGVNAVATLDVCTYSEPARFFSYRRATHMGEADYGRAISVIVLQ